MSAGNSEAWRRFKAAFLQIGLEIWSGFKVSSIMKNYKQILSNHALPSGKHLIGPTCILQQENNLKATVIKKYWFKKEQGNLEVMVRSHYPKF